MSEIANQAFTPFALSSVEGLLRVFIQSDVPSKHRCSMFAQRQKSIDFATEGLRLALPVERNYGIRVERFDRLNALNDPRLDTFSPAVLACQLDDAMEVQHEHRAQDINNVQITAKYSRPWEGVMAIIDLDSHLRDGWL